MLIPRFAVWMLSAGVMVLGSDEAFGQNYPNKPIRIVTGEVGGVLDLTARLISVYLANSMGQTVIVDNRGGASGALAAEIVAKAPPDGHTMLVYGNAVWTETLMGNNMRYDAARDYAPITLAVSTPNILVVHPSVAAGTVAELIALGKSKPGEFNYATSGTGSVTHLAAELFKSMAGVNFVRIQYRGTGQALIAMVAGEVQVMFPAAPAGMIHVKSGKLRALAITAAQRSPSLPDLPTVAASLPGYESALLVVIFVPAQTPARLVKRLNEEIVRVLNRPDVKDKFSASGADVVGSTPEQLLLAMKAEMARLSNVVRNAGIGK